MVKDGEASLTYCHELVVPRHFCLFRVNVCMSGGLRLNHRKHELWTSAVDTGSATSSVHSQKQIHRRRVHFRNRYTEGVYIFKTDTQKACTFSETDTQKAKASHS